MFITAQIMGIIANILFAISPQQKSKNKVIFFQMLSSIAFSIQYLLLGAYSGIAATILSMVITLIFWMYSKQNKKIPFYWLGLYITANIIAGIFTYTDIFSVFPIIISISYIYGIWQENLRVNRIIIFFGSIGWIIYNFIVGAYASSIGNAVSLFSATIAIWRLDIRKNKIM